MLKNSISGKLVCWYFPEKGRKNKPEVNPPVVEGDAHPEPGLGKGVAGVWISAARGTPVGRCRSGRVRPRVGDVVLDEGLPECLDPAGHGILGLMSKSLLNLAFVLSNVRTLSPCQKNI